MQWRAGAAVRVLGQPVVPYLHVALRPFQRLMPRHHRCKWTTLVMRKPVAGPAIRVLTKVRCRSLNIMCRPRSVAHRRGRNRKTITYRRRTLGDSAVASSCYHHVRRPKRLVQSSRFGRLIRAMCQVGACLDQLMSKIFETGILKHINGARDALAAPTLGKGDIQIDINHDAAFYRITR